MNKTETLNAARATAIAEMGNFIDSCTQVDTGEFLVETEFGQVSVLVTAKKTAVDADVAHQNYLDTLTTRATRLAEIAQKKADAEAAKEAKKAAKTA
jgi:hypothetical protein